MPRYPNAALAGLIYAVYRIPAPSYDPLAVPEKMPLPRQA